MVGGRVNLLETRSMANPGDRIRALEAENAALHREIVEVRNKVRQKSSCSLLNCHL